jgi:hypothetical protein
MEHLKNILFRSFTICLFLAGNFVYGQNAPQVINYQGIANDATGTPVASHSIGIKISIYSGTPSGILEWQETHAVTTNQFGLFSLGIGQGTTTGVGTAATFSAISWESANHFLKVSMDITGGTAYVDMDTSQLLSVPYSLYSGRSGSVAGPMSLNDLIDADTAGIAIKDVLRWDGSQWRPAKERDSVLYSSSSDSANFATTSNSAQTANHSIYSDTASYALNCANITNDWHLTGNSGISAATNFLGTTNAADLVMKTNNTERMRITSTGKIGIGTSTPTASVHIIGNDGLVAQGTFGSGIVQNLGTGTRMMWYPKKAAFRSGYAIGTNWDDANIGNYSFASGYNPLASGFASIAIGNIAQATDSGAVSLGVGTVAYGKYSVAIGNSSGTLASAPYSVAIGRDNTAQAMGATAIGYHCIASGTQSTAFGNYTVASGNNSVTMGYQSNSNNMNGTFIFSDDSSSGLYTYATASNQFFVKASGGTIFYTNAGLTSGVSLAPGGGAWLTVSDKNKKEHFKKIDGEIVLKKISEMDIPSWNYKTQNSSIRHIGPMAQDFFSAFKFGESDTTITTTDIDGINMIAIQALEKRTEELNSKTKELQQLKKQVDLLLEEKASLEKRLLSIEEILQNNSSSYLTSIKK